MSTTMEMTVYSRITDPLAFVREFGTEIAQSRMFGCANEAQGKVLAMACLAENENPIQIARKYHIIQNNLSMKADAMLAELRARGGKHKVIARTSDEACVEITYDGQTYRESLTWEDAQKERYVYGKDGQPKDNWATPRGRRQMLWARVISEAVRTLAPEIVSGTYTPEETHDFVEEAAPATTVVNAEQFIRETAAKANTTPVDDVVDVEAIQTATSDPTVAKCSADQRKQLRTLFDAVGATEEQVAKALEKRGVKAIRYLSVSQADELIGVLRDKAGQATEIITGESARPPDVHAAANDGPVGEVLVNEIKALLADDLDLMRRIKEYLVANGKQKVADLTHDQALFLKDCLERETVEAFFERSLVPFDADDTPSL